MNETILNSGKAGTICALRVLSHKIVAEIMWLNAEKACL